MRSHRRKNIFPGNVKKYKIYACVCMKICMHGAVTSKHVPGMRVSSYIRNLLLNHILHKALLLGIFIFLYCSKTAKYFTVCGKKMKLGTCSKLSETFAKCMLSLLITQSFLLYEYILIVEKINVSAKINNRMIFKII